MLQNFAPVLAAKPAMLNVLPGGATVGESDSDRSSRDKDRKHAPSNLLQVLCLAERFCSPASRRHRGGTGTTTSAPSRSWRAESSGQAQKTWRRFDGTCSHSILPRIPFGIASPPVAMPGRTLSIAGLAAKTWAQF